MGVLFGLLTAFCWGSSDFLARFATRRTGTLRTTLYMQLLGFVLLSAALPFLGGWGHLADGSGFRPWIWGIFAGALNTVATLSIYRSFELGKMSVVAPLSASYPVITVLLSLATGEQLTLARIVGIVLVLVGAIVVAREDVSSSAHSTEVSQAYSPEALAREKAGLRWALTASLAMGFMFWLVGIRFVPIIGALPSVWMIRLISALATLCATLITRQSAAPPVANARFFVLGMAVLDTVAYCFNNRGMQLEQVSIVSVLASLYGAVTVAYAAIILRERISRLQWLAITAIFAGIILISV
jgi:drug/metabolite transporter (DMT)-like permease